MQKSILVSSKLFNVNVLQFQVFNDMNFVKHAVYSRKGGISSFPFESLNVSFNVGDDLNCVLENRSIIHTCIGGDCTLYLDQSHSEKILIITKKPVLFDDIYFADAVITNVPGINIAIQTADCQAVMIVDPVKRVVANVHVGWRGSVNCILEKTISKMMKYFGCNPLNIVASLGPSLGPCCAQFLNYKNEFPRTFFKYKEGTSNFDFWRISKDQLSNSGVPHSSIYSSNLCTKCNSHLFFSYRKNKDTGRFATLIRIDK